MNINFIFIKRSLIGLLTLLTGYTIFLLVTAILSKPQDIKLNFSSIANPSFKTSIKQNISEPSTSIGFDYKLIGYRAGKERGSVIVERNNQSFVVQQGSLLENKYKLISVNSKFAIFEFGGDIFQLSTNLKLDN